MNPQDPLEKFGELLERAREAETADPTAVALATADGEGRPTARMVLLKGVDARGFVFFTNYGSRKAGELDRNPRAALCFYWPALATQVRVEGEVERTSEAESDAYFASRPRGHNLATWASRQSAVLADRRELLDRYHEAEGRFGDGEITRPPWWGGFRLRPVSIEFWHGFENRLHDRLLYRREGETWSVVRLNP
ncbi:MAG TPA: pyridoxamine 5'-phosphate oxidase [Vicinamibacteria bacterium]|nr:pyridoxamine 5'-phosphate oxidase [Vicinamibacteria bacterium]